MEIMQNLLLLLVFGFGISIWAIWYKIKNVLKESGMNSHHLKGHFNDIENLKILMNYSDEGKKTRYQRLLTSLYTCMSLSFLVFLTWASLKLFL